jgi:predicted lipoprotein with Yx(FWY)xxD motif
MRLKLKVIGAVAAIALLAAACGEDNGEAPLATPEDLGVAPAGTDTLHVASTDLGEILTDIEGLTLYLFQDDEPGVSNCTGECLGTWPALTDSDPTPGEGVDITLIGTITRDDDGTTQVTYNDWPLYYFSGDASPGDTNGQGIGGNWWVVSPEGTAIED